MRNPCVPTRARRSSVWVGWAVTAAAAVLGGGAPAAGDPRDQKIQQLETQVQALAAQVQSALSEIAALKAERREAPPAHLPAADPHAWPNKFTLGGYGEVHANFSDADGEDALDLHRLVAEVGYEFADWIRFHSEVELEHAFVEDELAGELGLEQAYLDFLLGDAFNVRAGRVLTPVGITNLHHEPPRLWGVERPFFDRFVVPTTWSSDGLGVFGALGPSLDYEAYVVAGLDGSEFSASQGIREGRIEDVPSLNQVAFTGRLDYFPFATRANPYRQNLRLGVSTWLGGVDNGHEGDNPGVDGSVQLYATDFEYSILDLEARGALAWIHIDGAEALPDGVAEEILGWYLEAGYHFWPDAWREGRLARSDALLFVRHDRYDTQHDLPAGRPADPAGDRHAWTLGVNFYPIPNLVIKADYQLLDDATDDQLENLFNFGLGWQF